MVRLDVRGLGVSVGGVSILSGVNLSFFGGELVCVLGPSGSGKSTLLRAMIGFKRAEGAVHLCGEALFDRFESLKHLIGYVPQDDVLHRSLTLQSALRYAARLRLDAAQTDHDAVVSRVLGDVGLLHRRHVRIRNLSGGQRRRASLAMELLAKPPVLVLDEPTSGLDPALESELMGLFGAFRDRGHLVVLSTHMLASLECVDLVVMVAGGRVVYVGPPERMRDFFEAEDLPAMYRDLSRQNPVRWAQKFAASSGHQTLVEARLNSPPPLLPTGAGLGPVVKPGPKAPRAQDEEGAREVDAEQELARLKRVHQATGPKNAPD